MKIIFALFFLNVFAFVEIQAQDLNCSITWGKEFKESNFNFNFLPIYDSSEYLALSERLIPIPFAMATVKPTFRRFSKEKDLISSNELDLEKEIPLLLKNKMYVLYPIRDNNDEEVLYADELDAKTLRIKNKKVKLVPTFKTKSGIMISQDRSKFLISRMLKEKRNGSKIIYSAFNDELKLIWEKELPLADSIKIVNTKTGLLDDSGNLYLGILESDGKQIRIENGKSNYRYEIVMIRENGQSINRIPIKLDAVSVTDMKVRAKDNFLFCVGFYSKKKRTGAKGQFLIKIDLEKGEIISSIQTDFDNTLIHNNNISDKGNTLSEDEELNNFQLRHFFVTKDNSFVLITEQRFDDHSLGGRSTTSHNYYFFNNIIAIKNKPTGEVDWIATIDKRQNTVDDAGVYSSYALAFSSDNMLFLFNDSPKNYPPAANGQIETFDGFKSVFVLASVDQNGNMHKQTIPTEKIKAFIQPEQYRQISKNEILIYGNNNHTGQVGKLTIGTN